MANKQGLIDHLLKHGKNQTWSTFAHKFGFADADSARKCWSRHRRTEGDSVPKGAKVKVGYMSTSSSNPTFTISTFPSSMPTKEEVLDEIRSTIVTAGAPEMAKKFLDFKQSLRVGTTPPDRLLELAMFDLHIGKLAWEEEVGEDYNIDLAVRRYKDAIRGLLSNIDVNNLDRILLPIGNDMINVDNKKHTTFNGTPQDCDSRFVKMVRVAKELLIDTIDDLALLAPVDVVIIHGNHDTHTMFCLGEILSAYYHNSPLVTINNNPTQRKYYSYGTTAIQFTHGNEERHSDLGLIFATEKPHMWGLSKHRFCQLGHFHKNKKISYTSVEDQTGFTIQILPSLSGSDAWHNSKGYIARKQAKAFLFSKENGLIAEYTYNG